VNKSLKRTRPATDPRALSLYTGVAALNPETLHAQAEASVRALYQEGQSANTQRSYASALKYWAAWFRLRYRAPLSLPVPVPVVLQFIVDHIERVAEDGVRAHDLPPAIDDALVRSGFKSHLGAPKLATVTHRLSVLSKAHALRESPNPVRDIQAQELLRRVRRAHAQRGELSKPKQALTKDPLEVLLATCTDGLIGIRDRALLLFAWASGGRRRSEVTRAVMEQLIAIDAHTYLYRLLHSKTEQTGAASHIEKPIMGAAAVALTAWLQASGITAGAIFRRIRGSCVAEALEPQAVRYIVKRRAALAGLSGDFSAHSLRSGFMTEAGRQNVPLAEAMALTGHRSVQSALRYHQIGSVQHTRAANLLQGSEAENSDSDTQ
jgi:site-specific recombinase XerD